MAEIGRGLRIARSLKIRQAHIEISAAQRWIDLSCANPRVDCLSRIILLIKSDSQVRPCMRIVGRNGEDLPPYFFRRRPVASSFVALCEFIMSTRFLKPIALNFGLALDCYDGEHGIDQATRKPLANISFHKSD